MLRWFKKPDPPTNPAPVDNGSGWWIEVNLSPGYTTFYDFAVYNPKGVNVVTMRQQISDRAARRRYANNLLAEYDKTRRREALEVYK